MRLYTYLFVSIICYFVISCGDDIITGYVQTKDIETSTVDSTSVIVKGEIKMEIGRYGAKCDIMSLGVLYSKNKEHLDLYFWDNQNWLHDSTVSNQVCSQVNEGEFACLITNLLPSTHYYVRAYAVINSSYSNSRDLSYENILYGGIKEFITKDGNKEDIDPNEPVYLSAPTGVIASFMAWRDNSHILIEWDKVSHAIVYKIWRSNQQDGLYILIGSSQPDYNEYEDWQPLIGDNYYKIKALNGSYESDFSEPAYCNFSLINTEPCPPTITSITGDASALVISWDYSFDIGCGTPGSFDLKKLNPVTGDADLIANTTDMRFVDISVHPGLNKYWVIAKNNYSEKAGLADISNEISLDSPTRLVVNQSGKNVFLSWNPVSEATSYKIFVSSSANGSYVEIDEINADLNTKDISYYQNTTKYFKIKAVWNPPYALPIGGVTSDFSNYVKVIFD